MVINADSEIEHRQGTIILGTDKLIGGWALVSHETRELGRETVNLNSYSSGFGRWKTDPGGMITKCAEARALRKAFPNILSGSYIREEMVEAKDINAEVQVEPVTTTKAPRIDSGKPATMTGPDDLEPEDVEPVIETEKKPEPKKTSSKKNEDKLKQKPKPEPDPDPDELGDAQEPEDEENPFGDEEEVDMTED